MSNPTRYVAVILKEPDTFYLATVPDFGACFAGGETIDEAKAGLPDALTLHIKGMIDDGHSLPSPRSRTEVLALVEHEIVEDYVIEIAPEAPMAGRLSTNKTPARES